MSAERADLLMAQRDMMVAVIMTFEQGKQIAGSCGETACGARFAC
ncbi:hypothetical protein [Paracoccus sp. PAMC 22219]|nr:hypothetical protein [Paracoccus sp. PAMC 22219]